MTTFMFPGQGSQSKGMGESLFDEFKDYTAEADKVLGYSIKELCLEDPNLNLNNTKYTQPAIYVVNALSYLKKIKENNMRPDYLIGHSLGEYNALFAAGAFDFETGLKLVKKRGELMSSVNGGGMLAIVGLTEKQVENTLNEYVFNNIFIANLNSKFQTVISGDIRDIQNAKLIFDKNNKVLISSVLKVSGAFHSPYMTSVKEEFDKYLESFSFSNLSIPVISNLTARPYINKDIKNILSQQINHQVKWTESIRYLMGKGEKDFIEIGHGTVLRKLFAKIEKEFEPLVIHEEIKVDSNNEDINEKMASSHNEKQVNNNLIDYNKKSNSEENNWSAESLGSNEFKKIFNLKYAYLVGGMYKGISSKKLVVKVANMGMLGFLGLGGLDLVQAKNIIIDTQKEIVQGEFGVNFIHDIANQRHEEDLVDLLLNLGVKNIEASGFMGITPAIIRYYANGLKRESFGKIISTNKIIAKISRPEVAEAFLSPAPEHMVNKLLNNNLISSEQAAMLKEIPMANAICVEADSAGHTDGGVAYTLVPSIIRLKDRMIKKYNYKENIPVGTAGGIGTPEAALAAFILGADFIMTGSINQCTAEAGISDSVKNLLEKVNVQDTEYAPAGDLFELGSKTQVLKKGVFFQARAKKLYDIYCKYESLDKIESNVKKQIEEKYFRKTFEEVYSEVKKHCLAEEILRAEAMPKYKMILVFKWYFAYSTRIAIEGKEEFIVDYQVQCGPALGAFNQWIKGTELEQWSNRNVDVIGKKIMDETADLFADKVETLYKLKHK